MSTMGMSPGPTDQPADIKENSEPSALAANKTIPVDNSAAVPKDSALKNGSAGDLSSAEPPKLETPEENEADAIFGFNPEFETNSEIGINHVGHAQPVTYVTQSRFFTPLFNAAIFDGPIRIYFAQHQESQAMKLYFNLQERYSDLRKQARDVFRERGANIFVMLYPDVATFEKAFAVDFDDDRDDVIGLGHGVGAEAGAKIPPSASAEAATGRKAAQTIATDRMGQDFVLGVRGPIEDETFETLCQRMETIIRRA